MENVDRNLEERIKHLCDRTSDSLDRRILTDLAGVLPKPEVSRPTATPAGTWRILMISRRIKLAVAAVVAVAIMLPVGYGAAEVIKRYFVVAEDTVTFNYPEPNGATSYMYGRAVSVSSSSAASEEEARAELAEFLQLYRQGKATEVKPGIWKATLSNGEPFAYGGDPEHATLAFTDQEKAQLKQQTDEINELRRAGKGERTFWKEVERDGVRIRLYNVRYTLSNGQVVTICEDERAK